MRLNWIFTFILVLSMPAGAIAQGQQSLDEDPPKTEAVEEVAESDPASAEDANIKLLDFEWKKSEILEQVLAERLKNVVIGAGYSTEKFRSSVVVLYQKGDPYSPVKTEEEQVKKEEKKPPVPAEDELDFPELRGNPLDIDQLLAKFQEDEEADRKLATTIRPKVHDFSDLAAQNADSENRYDISLVSMNVTLDANATSSEMAADRAKNLEDYIKNAFMPAFGKRFIVQVKPLPLVESFWPSFFDWMLKFGTFILALIIAGSILLLAYILKKVPTQRTPHQFKFDHNRKLETDHKGDAKAAPAEEENRASGTSKAPPVSGTSGDMTITRVNRNESSTDHDEESLAKEMSRLENHIIDIVKANPSLSRLMIQDFLRTDFHTTTNDEAMLRVALLLEILSKNKIQAEKLNVKPEIFKEFQSIRGKLSQISLADKMKIYEEVYWALVAFSFLSEGEQAFPPFHFLEMLDDSKVATLLGTESPEQQAMILLGMSEKKSAQVLEQLSPRIRQSIFEIMCRSQAPDLNELKTLSERVRDKSIPLFAAQNLPSSAAEGVNAIAALLDQLDFKSQYESIRSLAKDLKQQIQSKVFFSALLNEAKTDFLTAVFTDRTTESAKAIMAAFGEEFKQRVLAVLPPMQKRMLENTRLNEVSPAVILKTMQEVQEEIRAKIAEKKLSLDEIFDLTDPNVMNLSDKGPTPSAVRAA